MSNPSQPKFWKKRRSFSDQEPGPPVLFGGRRGRAGGTAVPEPRNSADQSSSRPQSQVKDRTAAANTAHAQTSSSGPQTDNGLTLDVNRRPEGSSKLKYRIPRLIWYGVPLAITVWLLSTFSWSIPVWPYWDALSALSLLWFWNALRRTHGNVITREWLRHAVWCGVPVILTLWMFHAAREAYLETHHLAAAGWALFGRLWLLLPVGAWSFTEFIKFGADRLHESNQAAAWLNRRTPGSSSAQQWSDQDLQNLTAEQLRILQFQLATQQLTEEQRLSQRHTQQLRILNELLLRKIAAEEWR